MTWVKKLDQGAKEVYAAACSRDNPLFARGFAVLRSNYGGLDLRFSNWWVSSFGVIIFILLRRMACA